MFYKKPLNFLRIIFRFSPYICTAKELGIVNGYPDLTFQPEKTINKAEALKMIGQVYEWGVREGDSESWYLPYTTYAENKNLIPEILHLKSS